jgi:hypothetical protein
VVCGSEVEAGSAVTTASVGCGVTAISVGSLVASVGVGCGVVSPSAWTMIGRTALKTKPMMIAIERRDARGLTDIDPPVDKPKTSKRTLYG